MDIKQYMNEVGVAARKASRVVARATTQVKNQALLATVEALQERTVENGVGRELSPS